MKLGSYLAALVLLVASPPALAEEVLRAFFTSGPQGSEREPIDSLRIASTNQPGVYFFSEIQGMSGQRIIHRWEHAGTVQFEVPFRVRSDHWSAYSYKKLEPSLSGRWTVKILDDNGRVLVSESLDFTATAPPPIPPPDRAPIPEPVEPAPVEPMPREAAMPEPEPPIPEPEPEAAMPEAEAPMAEDGEADRQADEPAAERPAEVRPAPIPREGVRPPRLGVRDDPERAWKDRSGKPR